MSLGGIDVVVVHYGPKGFTRRCLRALADDTAPLRSVTVVDSGSLPPLSLTEIRTWCGGRIGAEASGAGPDLPLGR